MRGIGYVVLDDRPEPERVRFAYVTDDEIRDMAFMYAAPEVVKPAPIPRQARHRNQQKRTTGPLLPDSLAGLLDGDEA